MKRLLKPRKRLLLILKESPQREQLMAILSGMGFWIDYETDMKTALEKFKHYRHPVVFVDEEELPKKSARLFSLFYKIQQNVAVVCMVKPERRGLVYTYLAHGAWDVITIPLRTKEVVPKVRRLLERYELSSTTVYFQYLLLFSWFLFTIWFLILGKLI
ncbi:MAG: hypothetical protein GX801_08240 [Fibrobacter sp.]|nr:hypothetical protein [Fibrobacter sp.]